MTKSKPEIKTCSKCKQTKSLEEFGNRKSSADGLDYWCKSCFREYNNLPEVKQRRKERHFANRDKILARHKIWVQNNKEHIRKYQREKRKNPIYRLESNLRSRINRAVKGHKSERTKELLGCTAEELRAYLEERFEPGMTWDNYGLRGWHVDHIFPCSVFDLTAPEQQRICFHYTNLRPMWAGENWAKHDKVIIYNPFKKMYNDKKFRILKGEMLNELEKTFGFEFVELVTKGYF